MSPKIFIVVGALIVLVLLASGGYYFWNSKKLPTSPANSTPTQLVATPEASPPATPTAPVVKIDAATTTETQLQLDNSNLDKDFQKLDTDTQGANSGLNDKATDLTY